MGLDRKIKFWKFKTLLRGSSERQEASEDMFLGLRKGQLCDEEDLSFFKQDSIDQSKDKVEGWPKIKI